MSKTNLRTPSQVEEISHYIQDQIQDHLDLTTHLIYSDKDNNALLEVADKIDAEKLFSSLYLKQLKSLNSRLQNSLKSVIEGFDYSKEKALEEIKALDLGVKDIEKINFSFSKDFHAKFESLNNTQLSSDLSVNLERGIESGINALNLISSKIPVTRPFALILQGLKTSFKRLTDIVD
ncbi:hypothetical protein JP0525_12820 [Helicobacter pylori]